MQVCGLLPVASPSEHGNEHLLPIKCGKFAFRFQDSDFLIFYLIYAMSIISNVFFFKVFINVRPPIQIDQAPTY
jgi:hypothetical protein